MPEMGFLVDDEALELMEHRRVGGVRIAAIGAAGRDHADGRLGAEHGAHLHRARMGTKQAFPVAAFRRIWQIKRIVHRAGRVLRREVKCRKVVEVVFNVRAFSHGCVRVQNPRDYASVLLSWDRAKVDSNTDSKKSQTVKLAKPVPIFITYFTAWPDDTGRIRYFADLYGRDETMEKALSTINLAQR